MDLKKVCKALSDSTRLEMFQILNEQSDHEDIDKENNACNCAFKKRFKMSQPTLTYHLKILEDAELINAYKHGKYTCYTVNYDTLDEVTAFFKEFHEK